MAAGKTLLLVLRPNTEFYVDTGDREYSGTGRNARVANLVAAMHTLDWLPVQVPVVASAGTRLRRSAASEFDLYYREFQEHLYYDAYFEKSVGKPFLVTRGGNHPVGTVIPAGNGHVVSCRRSTQESSPRPQEGKTARGIVWPRVQPCSWRVRERFGTRGAIPVSRWGCWSIVPECLPSMLSCSGDSKNMAALRQKFQEVSSRKVGLESFRRLLYETGKPLEDVVISALELLGFSATRIEGERGMSSTTLCLRLRRGAVWPRWKDGTRGDRHGQDRSVGTEHSRGGARQSLCKGCAGSQWLPLRPSRRSNQFTAKAQRGCCPHKDSATHDVRTLSGVGLLARKPGSGRPQAGMQAGNL